MIDVFFLLLGLAIAGYWIVAITNKAIPEWPAEKWRVIGHVAAELLTAVLCICAGLAGIIDFPVAAQVRLFATGMASYAVLAAGGYFIFTGQRPLVIVFLLLFLVLVSITIGSIFSSF